MHKSNEFIGILHATTCYYFLWSMIKTSLRDTGMVLVNILLTILVGENKNTC